MTRLACLLCAALTAALVALVVASRAQAQIDPGNFDIVQGGAKVGEVFVPARAPGAQQYIEHWVLFQAYVYPGPNAPLTTAIRPAPARYTSTADFINRVPWGTGFRYVRVVADDRDTLPGRTAPAGDRRDTAPQPVRVSLRPGGPPVAMD